MKYFLYVLAALGAVIVLSALYFRIDEITDKSSTSTSDSVYLYERDGLSHTVSVNENDALATPDNDEDEASEPVPVNATPSPTPTSSQKQSVENTVYKHKGKNSSKHFYVVDSPYDDVTDVKYTTLININHRLSKDYIPKDLVKVSDYVSSDLVTLIFNSTYADKTAVKAFSEMIKAAKEDGVTGFCLRSAYRSYNTQTRLWNLRVSQNSAYGKQRNVPLSSAYPGTSEHQTGLAFDITCKSSKEPSEAFSRTANFRWLRDNSYKFGFILRYDKDKTGITGIKYEPYHYRYVGKTLAKKLYENNITLEEYYNSPVKYE